MTTKLLLFIFVLLPHETIFAQLASGPKADELLKSALLTLDEVSTSYCARFHGQYSSEKNGAPIKKNLFGISAITPENEFHTWGTEQVLGPGLYDDIVWLDALRVGKDKKRFMISTGRGTLNGASSIEMESAEQLEQNPKAVWPWPEIDPFGMVFGTESRLQRKESAFPKVREQLLLFELKESRISDKRNVVGFWLSPQKGSELTIEFDRQKNNMPISVRWQKRDSETGDLGRLIGLTKVDWAPYKKEFVPRKISVRTERIDGQAVDVEMNWEWVPIDKWQKEPIDFETLLSEDVRDFRAPFIDLVDGSRKDATH